MVWLFHIQMDLVEIQIPQKRRVVHERLHQIHHLYQHHQKDKFHPDHHLMLTGVLDLLLMMEVRMNYLNHFQPGLAKLHLH